MTCARQSRRRLIRSVCSACATCCSCWRIHAINEIRTFVAIRLDETVRAALGAAIEGLRGVARDVAWVAPENLHLTLKFLGQVREPRPFSPHATLGRVRTPRRDPALADALLAAEGREFGRLSVERVALMRS